MGEIFVLAEHRQGRLREISFQMLGKAAELCNESSHQLTAIIIGGKGISLSDELINHAHKIIVVADDRLAHYNADLYKKVLFDLIEKHTPFLTIIGHTPWGMDLAPSLSVRTGFPLASDCVDILIEDGDPKAVRQIYNGKIYSRISFKSSKGYLVTMRPGSFSADRTGDYKGEVIRTDDDFDLPESRVEFIEYRDSGTGDIDISQADLLISIGRGIGEEENIIKLKELADIMGGVISCSRPIVDKNWLPKYHQVGTSGKSVKPKVYLAFGISGAFQHVAGISGAGLVIAVNKDKKAPIFRTAQYGVADDLFKIVDALKEILKK
jgi:electron transfer flavoprotein alpha subunit